MKKTLLIITALMLVVGCGSSEKEPEKEPINYETTLIERGRVFYTKDTDKPYSGPVFSLHKDGRKHWEGTLKDGKRDGKWWKEYENGKKDVQIIYKDGKRHGLYNQWYENGQKWSEKKYKDGVPDGIHTWWYSNGQMREEGTFKDGEKDGKWTEWSGGEADGYVVPLPYHKSFEGTYKKGELIEETYWDRNGNKN